MVSEAELRDAYGAYPKSRRLHIPFNKFADTYQLLTTTALSRSKIAKMLSVSYAYVYHVEHFFLSHKKPPLKRPIPPPKPYVELQGKKFNLEQLLLVSEKLKANPDLSREEVASLFKVRPFAARDILRAAKYHAMTPDQRIHHYMDRGQLDSQIAKLSGLPPAEAELRVKQIRAERARQFIEWMKNDSKRRGEQVKVRTSDFEGLFSDQGPGNVARRNRKYRKPIK